MSSSLPVSKPDDPKMRPSTENVSVAVRVCPSTDGKDEWNIQEGVIHGARPENQRKVFAFNTLISQQENNADVYHRVVRRIIKSAVAGYNGTVVAHGQNSSGKTHTMIGNDGDPGVIRRAITGIFDEIRQDGNREFVLLVSCMEVYSGRVRDLLKTSSSSDPDTGSQEMRKSGLTEEVATSSEQILQYLSEGFKNRLTSFSYHFIFRITIESSERSSGANKRSDLRLSRVNFVDFASSGSGDQGLPVEIKPQYPFLTALGSVVGGLALDENNNNDGVPHLKRILDGAFGGDSCTAFICNISPSDYEFTLSTLRLASRAERIQNQPEINRLPSEDRSLLLRRDKEVQSLRTLISIVDAGDELELEKKNETIKKLREKIKSSKRLSVAGDSHFSDSDENVSSVAQSVEPIAADSTAAEAAEPVIDLTGSDEELPFSQRENHGSDPASPTPNRPRKRKRDDGSLTDEFEMEILPSVDSVPLASDDPFSSHASSFPGSPGFSNGYIVKVESVARTGTNSKGVDSDNQLPPPTFSRAHEATVESTDAANRIPRSLNGEAKTHEVLEQVSGRQNIPEEEEVCPNGEASSRENDPPANHNATKRRRPVSRRVLLRRDRAMRMRLYHRNKLLLGAPRAPNELQNHAKRHLQGGIADSLRHVLHFENGVKTLREPFLSCWGELRGFYRSNWIQVEQHRRSGRKYFILTKSDLTAAESKALVNTAAKFVVGIVAKPDAIDVQQFQNLRKSFTGVCEAFARILCVMAACSDPANELVQALLLRPLVLEHVDGGFRPRCLLCPRAITTTPTSVDAAYENSRIHRIQQHRLSDLTSSPLIAINSSGNTEPTIEFDEFFYQIQAAICNHEKLRADLGLEPGTVWVVKQDLPKPAHKASLKKHTG